MTLGKYYILDDAGAPLAVDDLRAWAWWIETHGLQVADFRYDHEGALTFRVSTIFLGLDYAFLDAGPPVLWETMIFGGPLDRTIRRYTSRAAAVAGHAELVQQAMEARCLESTRECPPTPCP